MNVLKLISEPSPFEITHQLLESAGGTKKDLYIEGVFIQVETANKNKRIYPTNIMEREVKKFTKNYINQCTSMGELNHPPRPSIDPKEASHLITELKKEDNDYFGKAKILTTPVGLTVRSLLDDGVKLGVSTRGLGSLKEGTGNFRGLKIVQEDYSLITIDIVSDPSAPDAWVNGVFESVDYILENGSLVSYDAKMLQKMRDIRYKELKETTSKLEKLGVTNKLVDFIASLKNMKL